MSPREGRKGKMKVLRELPRETLDLMPSKTFVSRGPRNMQVGSNVHVLYSLFQEKPEAVFEIDCGSTYKNHPRTCHTQQAVGRINRDALLPRLLRAYHTNGGTLIVWMISS